MLSGEMFDELSAKVNADFGVNAEFEFELVTEKEVSVCNVSRLSAEIDDFSTSLPIAPLPSWASVPC